MYFYFIGVLVLYLSTCTSLVYLYFIGVLVLYWSTCTSLVYLYFIGVLVLYWYTYSGTHSNVIIEIRMGICIRIKLRTYIPI